MALVFQAFELRLKEGDESNTISWVLKDWERAQQRIVSKGYQLLGSNATTNGAPHRVLVGMNIEDERFFVVKDTFYEATALMPYASQEYYQELR